MILKVSCYVLTIIISYLLYHQPFDKDGRSLAEPRNLFEKSKVRQLLYYCIFFPVAFAVESFFCFTIHGIVAKLFLIQGILLLVISILTFFSMIIQGMHLGFGSSSSQPNALLVIIPLYELAGGIWSIHLYNA